ncbi:MAG: hypothetical protein IKG83_00185, partial [Prevotella sp.]|nr:hypothetical protein [Prevotella sp.]
LQMRAALITTGHPRMHRIFRIRLQSYAFYFNAANVFLFFLRGLRKSKHRLFRPNSVKLKTKFSEFGE